MRALAKLGFGLTLSLSLTVAAQSAEAQPPSLTGTFTGLVTSGEEVLYPFFDPPATRSLAGGTFFLDTVNIQEFEGWNRGSARMYVTGVGIGPSTSGAEDPFSAGVFASYQNGVLRLVVGVSGFGNDYGTTELFADRVNGEFVNWRGSVRMGGQTGVGELWEAQAVMPNLTFDGTFVGPVPEPATWAMMIAGFGLAGATLRRSGRAKALAA